MKALTPRSAWAAIFVATSATLLSPVGAKACGEQAKPLSEEFYRTLNIEIHHGVDNYYSDPKDRSRLMNEAEYQQLYPPGNFFGNQPIKKSYVSIHFQSGCDASGWFNWEEIDHKVSTVSYGLPIEQIVTDMCHNKIPIYFNYNGKLQGTAARYGLEYMVRKKIERETGKIIERGHAPPDSKYVDTPELKEPCMAWNATHPEPPVGKPLKPTLPAKAALVKSPRP